MRPLLKATTLLTVGLLLACGDASIRNCPLQASSNTALGLQYEMVLPSNCPVPLSAYGEAKYTGANIIDPNYYMKVAKVTVENTYGQVKAADLAFYEYDFNDQWSVIVETYYPAATAGAGNVLPPSGQSVAYYDDGIFESGPQFGYYPAWGQLRITYISASVHAAIAGPDVPLSNTSSTWSVDASGGTTPYSYNWYRNGQLVATGPSYTASVGTAEFGLRAEVTDQTLSSRTADFWVQVDGVRANLSGPGFSYASQGGATWTATARGGYAPYTYSWYVVNADGSQTELGSTSSSSWSGYPGEGLRELGVRVQDSHGASFSTTMEVSGFGDGGEGCQPVPPQLICTE